MKVGALATFSRFAVTWWRGRREHTHPLCDSPARKLRPGSDHPETPTNPTEACKSDQSTLFQDVSVAKGRKDAPDVSKLDTWTRPRVEGLKDKDRQHRGDSVGPLGDSGMCAEQYGHSYPPWRDGLTAVTQKARS